MSQPASTLTNPSRWTWNFHLSVLLIGVLVAAGLLFANTVRHQYQLGTVGVGKEPVYLYASGFPMDAYFDLPEVRTPLGIASSGPDFQHWIWFSVVVDILFAVVVLIAVCFGCEVWLRRPAISGKASATEPGATTIDQPQI